MVIQFYTGAPLCYWEEEEGPPLLMAGEIDAVVDQVRAKAKKASGPDGIPNSV